MNVVFVSHCDFSGNSAMHINSIANGLHELGVHSIVVVPNDPMTLRDHGTAQFSVVHHDDALRRPLVFPDGRGPDLLHAWTPRELVRRLSEELARRYEAPYIVHLEDNEEALVEDELQGRTFKELSGLPLPLLDRVIPLHRAHPIRYPRFIAGAAGVTVVMDTLLEFKPEQVPALVFWPGFDRAFADMEPDRSYRRRLGLKDSDLMVAYNGNVHSSNANEVRSLVLSVAAIRRRGYPLTLVRTGSNYADIPYYKQGKRKGFIIDLGFRPRAEIPRLLLAADVLVQPGRSGDFNDYRFPSKLPEFLASGVPALLPATNIGRFLKDGTECVLLDDGHALEIAAKLEPMFADPDLRRRIGAAGREFALRELTWNKATAQIKDFYDQVLDAPPRKTPATAYAKAPGTATPAAGCDYCYCTDRSSPQPDTGYSTDWQAGSIA